MTEPVRLSKRMSELGLSSRREADEWIARGWVRVDGQVVSELGSKVLPHQKITVERQAAAEQSKRVTVLINKPMGYVSGQAEDGYTPAVALIKPENHWADDPSSEQFHPTQLRSLVPAGRLDIDSVGLLVLTQDGRVAKTLIGILDWKLDPQVAVDLPNVGSRNGPTELEAGTEAEAWKAELEEKGHEVRIVDQNSGIQAIVVTPNGLLGGADSRREGVAIGH